ncbi:dual specificity mitogen-activated protein kinase kinase hemipterous-like [Topomyia yanbarensis]|uniref:dual specificity mitogen-activated protein kinase kinase hemipterous-like n=1 Tax=Topomyia yanbarensis TaxID=2498891 RepID=UPI00273C4A73|nr:dual specificity mitogen-activated protein kinase kinase hemipterous-like [Topomyia yanbarensis]
MSGQSSIGNRINMIEAQLQVQQPQPQPRTPPTPPTLNFDRAQRGGSGGFGSSRGRPNLDLPLPPIQSGNRRSDSELRFHKIIEKSGMLKINDQTYKTTLTDMQDLGELGSGTSGHVVKMRHRPSGAIIAVKQMRRTGNDEENKRIIMDLDVVLKSEKCKYIVKCLGCFITDADVWICMELMTTCFDKLQKKSKMPVPEQILGKVTVATVNALAYLKEKHHVIHRDVKPSNILIDDRGNIKLCDFGISGRLVDSNAKTRSAGCAAYMAPERIDPAKSVYDIRADVWSLGITLVELATAVFPYRGCKTDFEVLTKVLTSNPPRLPEDQPFSPEFRDFVQRCLQKDYLARPKYPDLLKHPFLLRAEQDSTTDVAGWFRNVAVNSGIQLSTPQLVSSSSVSATGTTSGLASVSSPTAVSSQRPSSSASDQNRVPTPYENLTEAVQAQSNQQKQTAIASSIPIMSSNTPNHTSTTYEQQNKSFVDPQQILQVKLNSISLAPATSTSSSTTPYDLRSPSPAHHLQQQQMQTPQAHYLKLQPKSAIVSNSNNFSNISSIGPEGNRKYKQSPFFSRRTDSNADPLTYGSPKKESTLSSLGQSIFKNLTTSPFSNRKAEQKSYKPPLPGEDGGGGCSMLNGNRPGFSNPSSPLLLNRKMIDLHEEQQYRHLQGNTSPIVLQRFYHQQNQLRETKQHQLELQSTNPFYQQPPQPSGIPIKYSPLPSHRTVHHPTNPALAGGYVGYPQMVPPEASNIPTYQYQQLNSSSPKHKTGGFFNTFSRTRSQNNGTSSTSHRLDRGDSAGNDGGYPEGGFYQNQQFYGRQTLPEYGSAGYAMQSGLSNGDNMKDDTGWFNSIADLAKRRFASFVKLNLAATGEKRPKDKHLQHHLLQQQQQQQQLQHQQQYPFGNGATVAPMNNFNASSTNPFAASVSGIPSGIPPSAALHMLSSDRRHRSPDPPPRYNRGQSPLLLHRKLEKLGQTGSPILNQRFTSASPSPPLPPRRGSESVPGSPQHIRTRIHYTPEPHRRPYRTIDQ